MQCYAVINTYSRNVRKQATNNCIQTFVDLDRSCKEHLISDLERHRYSVHSSFHRVQDDGISVNNAEPSHTLLRAALLKVAPKHLTAAASRVMKRYYRLSIHSSFG